MYTGVKYQQTLNMHVCTTNGHQLWTWLAKAKWAYKMPWCGVRPSTFALHVVSSGTVIAWYQFLGPDQMLLFVGQFRRHFQILLKFHHAECNQTSHKFASQVWFFGPIRNQYGRTGLRLLSFNVFSRQNVTKLDTNGRLKRRPRQSVIISWADSESNMAATVSGINIVGITMTKYSRVLYLSFNLFFQLNSEKLKE